MNSILGKEKNVERDKKIKRKEKSPKMKRRQRDLQENRLQGKYEIGAKVHNGSDISLRYYAFPDQLVIGALNFESFSLFAYISLRNMAESDPRRYQTKAGEPFLVRRATKDDVGIICSFIKELALVIPVCAMRIFC